MSDPGEFPQVECSCRVCGLKFIPSLFNDFYPDVVDGSVGRCERCMMHEDLCTPVRIAPEKTEVLCRFRQKALTCAFLIFDQGGFCCAKSSVPHNNMILKRWREDSMSAKGNYCFGPPLYQELTADEIAAHRQGAGGERKEGSGRA